MRLRPHHIYCSRFLDASDHSGERGTEFEEAKSKIRMLFQKAQEDIEVKEGPDLLCEACPHFNGQMCSHPKGDEKEVKKWDIRILQGLGLEFGQVLKVEHVKSLIREKTPLEFCLIKCPYYREKRCNPRVLPPILE